MTDSSTSPAVSLAAVLITILCVVLAQTMDLLLSGNAICIAVCIVLIAIILVPTIIIWRQPESSARLTFKVSAARVCLVSAAAAARTAGLCHALLVAGSQGLSWS